jgi:hypothetical protein
MPEESSFTVTPYVQLAAFCQTALQEPNGILSVIRITDRFQIVGQTAELQSGQVNLTLAVVLKSGNMQCSSTMTIRPTSPNGIQMGEVKVPVLFEGQERGVGVITQIAMVVKETGLFWFDVLIDGVMLTRIPLRILYFQGRQTGSPPPPTT